MNSKPADKHWRLIAAAAAASAAAVIASRMVATSRQRRRLLAAGQLRELQDVWTYVEGRRVFARASVGRSQRGDTPLVLVHGWGVSGSYFIPAAERLAAEFAVYAPDLPGHGRSDTPRVPCDIRGFGDALIGWLDAMGIERATLVGHSMGSQIAVEAALQQPQRIDRLILMGLTPDPQGRSTPEQFRRFAVGGMYERVSLNNHMLKDYFRMGRRLVPEFRFMRDDPIEHTLPKVTTPVMLVSGEKDPMSPQRWTDEAARLLRTNRIAVIPGWGHAVQFSAPQETVEAIQPFLREQLVPPAAPASV